MSPYLSLPTQLIHMVFFMYSFCVLADHEVGRTYSSFIWSLNWASSFFFFFFQPSPHSPCYYFQEILAAFPYLIISSLISKMLCIQWVMLILELVLTVSVPVNGPSRHQQQWPWEFPLKTGKASQNKLHFLCKFTSGWLDDLKGLGTN